MTLGSNRSLGPQVIVGLDGEISMTRSVYVALVLTCMFVGAVMGASIVGLAWLWSA